MKSKTRQKPFRRWDANCGGELKYEGIAVLEMSRLGGMTIEDLAVIVQALNRARVVLPKARKK